jgi:hypothetical protein
LNTPEKQVEKCVSPLFYAGSINYEQEYLHFHMGNTGLLDHPRTGAYFVIRA